VKNNLVLYDNEEWVGLYSDGKLLDEGHSISMLEFCDLVDIPLTIKTADEDWLCSEGGFPDNIKDVKENN
jgi:hypothetical protein